MGSFVLSPSYEQWWNARRQVEESDVAQSFSSTFGPHEDVNSFHSYTCTGGILNWARNASCWDVTYGKKKVLAVCLSVDNADSKVVTSA